MTDLPKSITDDLFSNRLPGDITLGELKLSLDLFSGFKELQSLAKHGVIRVRFLIEEEEAPDEMPLAVFRSTPGHTIVIDDLGGGAPARIPERVS